MGDQAVPAALADVVGPLREADEYTRLQAIRQRGFYNIVTGLPMALFGAPTWLPMWFLGGGTGTRMALTALVWILFFLSCFPRLFLPVVRRMRPDWQSPLLAADPLKKALEKQFWFQFPFVVAHGFLVPLVAVIIFTSHVRRGEFGISDPIDLWTRGITLVLLVVALPLLSWQARRTGDRPLAWMFLAWLPVGVLGLLLGPRLLGEGQGLGSLFAMVLFQLAIVTPPLLAGLGRLLAPRRWLVR